MIDHRTGVVYIPDVENVTLDVSGLYLTFYKYVGGKGVGIEYDRNNNLTVQPSGGFISFGSKFAVGKTNPSTELDVSGSITASGNVGIGTTTPSTELDVSGSITASGNVDVSGNVNVSGNVDVSGTIIANGNVGIGTTSPTELLTVGNNSTNNSGGGTSMSILAPGENADAILYFGTQSQSNTSNAKKAAIIAEGINSYSRSSLHFCLDNTLNNSNTYNASLSNSRMTIRYDGNVGIGTTSPRAELHIGGTGKIRVGPPDIKGTYVNSTTPYQDTYGIYFTAYQDTNTDKVGAKIVSINRPAVNYGHLIHRTDLAFYVNNAYGGSSSNDDATLEAMRIVGNTSGSPSIGIGTTSPSGRLDVNGSTYLDYMETSSWIYIKGSTGSYPLPSTSGYRWNKSWSRTGATWVDSHPIALRIDSGSIYSQNDPVLHTNSDIRIKKDIEDVPDNLSLEMVRNIPCKYYKYIDEGRNIKNNDKKVIGFIAQEVKEVFPLAVDLVNDFEPNENRLLENISWEKFTDSNDVCKYKLISDLQDVSGVKYKFYMINDPSGNVPETKKEIIGNHDNTFTFDNSWNYVFCVGREINDFHALDKSKLFTLNFSATQELDRKVIALQARNTELENKVSTLESELAAIKAHLGL